MALARTQFKLQDSSTNYVNSMSIALTSPVTAGALLVLFATSSNTASAGAVAVTDNNGNTWVKVDSTASPTRAADMWYCKNANAGATTIDVTDLPTYAQRAAIVVEFAGANTTAPLDVASYNIESGYTDVHSISATNTYQPALIFAGFAGTSGGGSYTGNGDHVYHSVGDSAPAVAIDTIISSIGSQTATISAGGTAYEEDVSIIGIFKEAAASGPADVPATTQVNNRNRLFFAIP